MASTSRTGFNEEDEAQEEEVERFDDFTIASSWERFISDIEATCRLWLADGPKNLLEKGAVPLDDAKNIYKVKSDLKNVKKNYCIEYYFELENSGKVADWNSSLHDLQLCFGVKEFLVIAPQSASAVVLDAPEASKLLSAVAIALSNCSSLWPVFVPVHDPSRKAFIGIQSMGTVFTRRFESDHIANQVPVKFMHLEGLYELFVSKFAYTMSDVSIHHSGVHFRMQLTYRTISFDEDNDGTDPEAPDSVEDYGVDTHNKSQWDDGCPWSEWYSAEDPIKAFDLIVTWSDKVVEGSSEMAVIENLTPHEAQKWTLLLNLSQSLGDSSMGNRIGFASQLLMLVNALDMSFEAQFMEDFVSAENPGSDNLKSTMVIPPPTVLDRVLKDLFREGTTLPNLTKGEHKNSRAIKGAPLESLFAQLCLHALWFGNCNIRALSVLWTEFVREVRWYWEESQPIPKIFINDSIDLSTCLINQKLQMLAICIERKRELNEEFQDCMEISDDAETHIEEHDQVGDSLTNLYMPNEDVDGKRKEDVDGKHKEDVDGKRKKDADGKREESIDGKREKDVGGKRDSTLTADVLHGPEKIVSGFCTRPEDIESTDQKQRDCIRLGSAGPVGSMMLLKSCQIMHAPFTQDPPLMTEDMHEERLKAVEAFGNSFSFSAQLEKDILSSDMSAFKAANPDAVFEDFIRWHSPRDWEDEEEESGSSMGLPTGNSNDNWPPRGKLSRRMSDHGNLWRNIWNKVPALPASEQKPLLDPNREGEKIIHYLETVRPSQLLEQMICTAFRASADTLHLTHFGGLKQMSTKLDQLYATMRSTLKYLQVDQVSKNSEIFEDLRRLCVVFEHVEKLLTLASSLHRKFLQTPRVSEALFGDFYKFYLPKMGKGSKEDIVQETFKTSLVLRTDERQVVSDMFVTPTANQSWRKVLSMGNLLNGHEPILREIIFSLRDAVHDHHYASSNPPGYEDEIETYRMYTCGTSNDLRVALSITSFD